MYEQVLPEEVDFRPLLQQPQPQLHSANLRWWDLERYSNRQKSTLKIGGLLGEMELRDITHPWWLVLQALQEVHLGKSTIMGLGKIRLEQR